MARFRRRRAVSEVVGVLIMLAVVVSMGVLIFSFASGGMNSLSEGYAAQMSRQATGAAERFAVEQATFTLAGGTNYAPLVVDGAATSQAVGASSSISATLSTTSSNDVVVAYVSAADTGATAPPSVSGISGGGLTWYHRATSASQTYTSPSYVSITLTNSQTAATPNPFQQKVTWNPSAYSAHEASDLGNVRFCTSTSCSTMLYGWLESCASSCVPSATSASAWVQLTSSIAGSGGALTIYMVFESTSTDFDGVYWGEAPQLSATYAQYDNGASVFSFYDDFAGTTLSPVWTSVTNFRGSVTVNNGATFTTTRGSGYAFVVAAPIAYPSIAEAYMVSETTTVDPMLGVTTSSATNSWIAPYSGYSVDDCTGGCGGPGLSLDWQQAGGGGQVTSQAEAFNPGVWQMAWSATGAESASDGSVTLTGADSTVPIADYGIFLGQSDSVAGSNVADWARMRAFPPSGVMPSVSLGSFTAVTTTFDLEEWYATSSSSLGVVTVSASLSSPDTAATWIAVFGVSGVNVASPFDPNVSVPATASGANSVQTTVSTSDANDMLLFGCAAGAGSVPTAYTSIYSNAYAPYQNELAGYDTVSSTQSGLVTSCGGTGTYGTEITDSLTALATTSYPGANLFVRNVGSVPARIVSVYVTDTSSNAPLVEASMSVTLNVGKFAEITSSVLDFTPTSGDTYTFTVLSSLGASVTYDAEAA